MAQAGDHATVPQGGPSEPNELWSNVSRTASFWGRTIGIYSSYKATQCKAFVASLAGKSQEEIQEQIWEPQHQYAGDAMYDLCISLRGFYLKAGQFIGSRNDFVPDAICKRLCLLCDKVPPMSPALTEASICRELGVKQLSDVFEWIDLEKPLGSASVAQVHKAKLRVFPAAEVRAASTRLAATPPTLHTVAEGQGAWDVCNTMGITPQQLTSLNKGVDLEKLQPGQVIKVPAEVSLDGRDGDGGAPVGAGARGGGSERGASAVAAVLRSQASGTGPEDGLVAVKVQYPNALGAMSLDLKNLRAASYYLSKTEIKFDLVSAVDELNKQIKLEFDFNREARVMDTIAGHLSDVSDRIQVPRSVPGLVSKRLLVMQFLGGTPLLDCHRHMTCLSAIKQKMGKRRIMERVSEAYGRMILGEGLFQADGHPGNILVSKGGRIGLLDYGQSKQLSQDQRLALARLILQLDGGDSQLISSAVNDLGIITANNNTTLRTEMAYGMFDTRGKVNPFDPNSPITKCRVSTFPPDLFFVLRVVQLLRGMAHGMNINDFSSAHQWAPLARQALRQAEHRNGAHGWKGLGASNPGHIQGVLGRVARVIAFPFYWPSRGLPNKSAALPARPASFTTASS